MAESYSAGRLLVAVVPDMRGGAAKIRKEFSGLGPYDVRVQAQVDDKALKGLRAALRSLPDVVITADSSPADRELAALRGRLASLSDQTIGVDVSAADAHREVDSIRADLERLNRESPEIGVRVDAAAAEASLSQVSAELGRVDGRKAKVTVDADTGRANAALGTTNALASRMDGRRITMNVLADAARATAQILGVYALAQQLINRRWTMTVTANTASAAAGILKIISLVGALGGLAGVAGGLAGAIGGIGAAAVVAGAGVAAVIPAFLGVGKAIGALNDQQANAGQAAAQSAKAQQAAAAQVESAQRAVGKASEGVNRARIDGARAVEDAERSAGRNIAAALQAQEDAQRQLIRANRDARMAQQELTRAWEDGRRALEDLQDRVDDNALDQRQAAFDLADARKALAEAQATGDTDQIARAQLAYDRVIERVDQLNKRTQRGAVDNAAAQRAGVAGTEQYRSALDRVHQTQEGVADAQRNAARASAAVDQARADGARDVQRAQMDAARSISDAQAQLVDSQRQLTQALADTATAGTDAGDKVAQAFADLSPAAAAFARYIFGLKPVLNELSAIAAAGLFPPLMAGIDTLLGRLPLIKTVVGQLSAGMGAGLNLVLTTLANPTWAGYFSMLGNAAGSVIPRLFGSVMILAGAFMELVKALLPIVPASLDILDSLSLFIAQLAGPLVQALSGMFPAVHAFIGALGFLGPLLVALSPILNAMGVALSQVLGAALQALTPILVALTPFLVQFAQSIATGLVGAIQAATPWLVSLATWMSENPGLVMGVVGAVVTLLGFLKPLSFVLSLVALWAARAAAVGILSSIFAAVGLQGSLLSKVVLGLLRPFSAIGLAASAAGGYMALFRNIIMWIGRAILTALGPIGILIMLFGMLYASSEPFRNAINGLLGVLMGLIGTIVSAVMPIFTTLGQVLGMLGGLFGMLVQQLAVALVPVINLLAGTLSSLVGAILPPLMGIVGALVPVIMLLGQAFAQIVTAVLGPLIGALGQLISAVLPPLVFLLQNVVIPVITFLVNLFAGILTWAITNVLIPAIQFLIPILVGLAGILSQAIAWTVTNVVVPALNFLVPIFQWIGAAALWLWHNAIVPAWNAISSAISWAWTTVISPVINFIWQALKFLGAIIFVVLVAPFLIAFNLVSAAAMWLWTNAIQPAFQAIGTFIGWVWTALIKPALDALVWFWQYVITPAALWLWNTIIKPTFQAIGAFIAWVWTTLIKPALDALVWLWTNVLAPAAVWLYENIIRPMWEGIGNTIRWVWENVIRPAFDAVKSGLDWVGEKFNAVTDWIGEIWNKIRGYLAKPINFMIDTVWNKGIVPAWNWVAGLLGIGLVQPLPLIPEAATGGPIGDPSGGGTKRRQGGMLRGPGTGTSDSIMGVDARTGVPTSWVSNREFVVNEKISRAHRPFLEALNAGQAEARQAAGGSGARMPGYAGGGAIAASLDRARRFAMSQSGKPYQWGGTGNPSWDCSGFMGGITHEINGRSGFSGRIGTTATMPWGGFAPGLHSAFTIGNTKSGGHMAGTLDGVNVESGGSKGVHYGGPAIGADNGMFGEKYHLPTVGGAFVSGGQGSGGGGFDMAGWLLETFGRPAFFGVTDPLIQGLRDFIGPPPPAWRDVPPGFVTKVRDDIWAWTERKVREMFPGGGGGGVDISGISGPVVDQVRQVADRYGWGAGPEWDAIMRLIQKESSWDPGAANPNSSARGLFQKMTSLHGPVEPTPAGQANWGLNYIRGRYGSPTAALAFHNANNHYARGGFVSPFDSGGVASGTGIMFKDVIADERVLDPEQTGDYDVLADYRRMIDDGRLVPARGLDARQLAAMSADASGPSGREMHLHVHGNVNDPMDLDSLYNQLDWRERSATL